MKKSPFNLPINQLPVIELAGDFTQMGQQYGEACKQQIHELADIRLQAALQHAKDRGRNFNKQQALDLAAENIDFVKNYDANAFAEMQGICQAAGISMAELYIMQGLTDFRDFLSWGKTPDGLGCTSLIISRERSKSGKLLLAQNWDLQTSNMPYVCFVKRRPQEGPQTLSLTIAGGLSMIAINSEGLAIGTNNIKTIDSRPGLHYLNIIHKVMSCRSVKEAVKTIDETRRSGAHYYLIGDKNGDFSGLECSATRTAELPAKNGLVTHCNHPIHPAIDELNAEDMGQSTCNRQMRINELTQTGQFDEAKIKEMLSDHEGGDLAICRHDVSESISTNASIIISPETGEIHACRSHPHSGIWQSFTF